MEKNIKNIFKEIDKILNINNLTDCLDYLDGVEPASADERLIYNELQKILEKLEEIKSTIDYLDCPIKYQGKLYLNNNGRYVINDCELKCGSIVEILITSHGIKRWVLSNIEADKNGNYYLKAIPSLNLHGATARKR